MTVACKDRTVLMMLQLAGLKNDEDSSREITNIHTYTHTHTQTINNTLLVT